MQQQRTHEARVRETAPPKLLELIRAAFEYSAELGEVQTALQDTFDVAKLRGKYTAAQCSNPNPTPNPTPNPNPNPDPDPDPDPDPHPDPTPASP